MKRDLRQTTVGRSLQRTIAVIAMLFAFQGIPAQQDENNTDSVDLLLEHVASLGNRYADSPNRSLLNSNSNFFQTAASVNFAAGLDFVPVVPMVADRQTSGEKDRQLHQIAGTPKKETNSTDTSHSTLTIEDVIEFSSVAMLNEGGLAGSEVGGDASVEDDPGLIAREVAILPRPKLKENVEESALLAYAPGTGDVTESEEVTSLFELFQRSNTEEEETDSHNWIYGELPIGVVSETEQKCLAQAVYFEARGETTEGQVAVAQVVLNRVRDPSFPNSICEVVFQNEFQRHRCQFSFACDGISERIHSVPAWEKAQRIARNVTYGISHLKNVGQSTHFHAVYVDPVWAKTMEKKAKIGLHIFYLAKL